MLFTVKLRNLWKTATFIENMMKESAIFFWTTVAE